MPTPVSKESRKPLPLPSPQELFNRIVETLVAKELAKYSDADPFRTSIPNGFFNLIPPRPAELDLNHLMSLIEWNGTKGKTDIGQPELLTDIVEVPAGPYLVLDIEDGRRRNSADPLVSEQNILAKGRSPYVAFEGFIHGIVFPEVFESHHMDLCGSRFWSRFVPYFLRLSDGVHLLGLPMAGGSRAAMRWGAPSCGSRRGA